MAIALEVHGSSIEDVHDQAATETELMLICSRVTLSNIGMFLLNDADEERWVIAFNRHADCSCSEWVCINQ